MLPTLNLPGANNIPNVNKVIIYAHKGKSLLDMATSVFVLPISPENYSRTHKVHLDKSQPMGTDGAESNYRGSQPETIKLDFTFDNTGTVEGNSFNDVPIDVQIELFKKVTLKKNKDIHKPFHLKIIWGTLVFSCVLENLDVTYTLFNKFGIPIRAKLSATFVEYIEKRKESRNPAQNSPDVTHLKNIVEGDTIPRLSFEIYGNTKYYLQVAQANNLTSFRNIKGGSEIVFPSIEKI